MRTLKKYAVVFAAGAIPALFIAGWRGAFSTDRTAQVMLALSDGCLVSAVLFLGSGMLRWISSTGFFDLSAYGFGILISVFGRGGKRQAADYFEYTRKKQEERRSKRTLWHLIWVGMAYLTLSGIFTVLFFRF